MLVFLGGFSVIAAGCGIAEALGVPTVDDNIAEGLGLPVAAVDEGGRVLGFGPPETRFEGNLTKTAVGSFDSVYARFEYPPGTQADCPVSEGLCLSTFLVGKEKLAHRVDRSPESVCLKFLGNVWVESSKPEGSHQFPDLQTTTLGELCLSGVPSPGVVRIRDITCDGPPFPGTCRALEIVSAPAGAHAAAKQ
jgi:hypothetical protein